MPDATHRPRRHGVHRPPADHSGLGGTMKTATDAPTEGAALPAVQPNESSDRPRTDVSWVDRCQRQFGDDDRRLGNLADGENAAFYDGV